MSVVHGAVPVTVIDADHRGLSFGLGEVWEYRSYLLHLARREIKGRYRATSLGHMWLFIRPLMEMATYVLIFGLVLGLKSSTIPYPMHVYSGVVVWIFFQSSGVRASSSLTGARALLDKVFFPRLIVPLVQIGANALDLLIASGLIIGLIAYYWFLGPLIFGTPAFVPSPRWAVLIFPLFFVMLLTITTGFSLLMAAWQVYSADVGMIVPVLLRLGMYFTPVIYPLSRVPEAYRDVYLLNPMAVILEGLRWTVFGTASPPALYILWAGAVSLGLLIWGLWAFRKTERTIVDIL